MRDFVTDQILANGGIILVGYFLLSLFLVWKGKRNLKEKSRSISDAILVLDWDKSSIWINRLMVPIVLAISLGIYSGDYGWLADLIALFLFGFDFFLFLGSLIQEKIFVRSSSIDIVPMFGKVKEFPYSKITRVLILRSEHNADEEQVRKYKLTIFKDEEKQEVNRKPTEITALLAAIKEKVDKEKFELQNESAATKEG